MRSRQDQRQQGPRGAGKHQLPGTAHPTRNTAQPTTAVMLPPTRITKPTSTVQMPSAKGMLGRPPSRPRQQHRDDRGAKHQQDSCRPAA